MITLEQLRGHLDDGPPAVCIAPDGTATTTATAVTETTGPFAVFPGSFNPLHTGHRSLAHAAEQRLGHAVHFEISLANVDKADLDPETVWHRVQQFRGVAPVWLTRAARFTTKAVLFPNTIFVLGYDTAKRLVDPHYYADDPGQRDVALRQFQEAGCRAIVAGRIGAEGQFHVWNSDVVPREFQALFLPFTEAEFRVDLSSSELRQHAAELSTATSIPVSRPG